MCYRLFSREALARMRPHPLPEIARVALESVVLQAVAMGQTRVEAFLNSCMDPPPEPHVRASVDALDSMGALRAVTAGWELTPLGQHLARMPLEPRLAKLLVFSCLFHCVSPCLTIAAVLSSRGLFRTPTDREARSQVTQVKRLLAWSESDHLTYVRVYDAYRAVCDGRPFPYPIYAA